MIQALIGQKLDQTQKFLENGQRIPVTEVLVNDNIVVQVKAEETDRYTAVQVGFGSKKNATKAVLGHVKKAKLEKAPAVIKEVALQKGAELPEVGTNIAVETVFKPGDIISVTGTSKGKGFAGAVKRHGFGGGPKTHGQSDRHRAPGSIGQGTTPGRVYKGKRMAGHMGAETVTVQNLLVVDVDAKNKKIYVKGLVPGNKKGTILLTLTGEMKKFVPLLNPTPQVEEEVVAEEQTTVVEAAAEVAEQQAEAEAEIKEAANDAASDAVESKEEEATSDVADSAPKEEEKKEEKKA